MPSTDEPYTCNTRAEMHTHAHTCIPHASVHTHMHTCVLCAHGRHTCISTHIGAHLHMHTRRTRISTYTGIPGTPRGEVHTLGHVPEVDPGRGQGLGPAQLMLRWEATLGSPGHLCNPARPQNQAALRSLTQCPASHCHFTQPKRGKGELLAGTHQA